MHSESNEPWRLDNFIEALDRWIQQENPPDLIRQRVTAWVLTRLETPYAGVVRQEGFANLWYGVVPGTAHGDHQVVTCAYWIDGELQRVRCDSIATLSAPA
jgi:hypothetical protein